MIWSTNETITDINKITLLYLKLHKWILSKNVFWFSFLNCNMQNKMCLPKFLLITNGMTPFGHLAFWNFLTARFFLTPSLTLFCIKARVLASSTMSPWKNGLPSDDLRPKISIAFELLELDMFCSWECTAAVSINIEYNNNINALVFNPQAKWRAWSFFVQFLWKSYAHNIKGHE
mgnify:CR=1 FL=1